MQGYTENKLKVFIFRLILYNVPKQNGQSVKYSEIITHIHAGRYFETH